MMSRVMKYVMMAITIAIGVIYWAYLFAIRWTGAWVGPGFLNQPDHIAQSCFLADLFDTDLKCTGFAQRAGKHLITFFYRLGSILQ